MSLDEKYLFICCPNNSGGTLLMRLLERAPGVVGLGREGQDFMWENKCGADHRPLGIARVWSEDIQLWRDPANYDWPKIKRLWNAAWQRQESYRLGGRILMEKSPPNVLRIEMLEREFPGAAFILMVRNPYAVCEGIKRRTGIPVSRSILHWIRCTRALFEAERRWCDADNGQAWAFTTYEKVCDDPEEAAADLTRAIPGVDAHDLSVEVTCHTMRSTKDVSKPDNLNWAQIRRLSRQELRHITEQLKARSWLMEWAGYSYIEV